MLAIRLSRTGSKKRPFFRVVVSDSTQARDSRFVEILGHYNPRAVPAVVKVDQDRIAHWLKVGARPSDTVRTLLAGHVTPEPVAVTSTTGPVAAPPTGEASGQ
jgi:small subunit ribosomal protein S16